MYLLHINFASHGMYCIFLIMQLCPYFKFLHSNQWCCTPYHLMWLRKWINCSNNIPQPSCGISRIHVQSNLSLATILCQTEKWPLTRGGHFIQVKYSENTMHGGHWQWSLGAGGFLEEVVIRSGLTVLFDKTDVPQKQVWAYAEKSTPCN